MEDISELPVIGSKWFSSYASEVTTAAAVEKSRASLRGLAVSEAPAAAEPEMFRGVVSSESPLRHREPMFGHSEETQRRSFPGFQ